MHGNGINTIPFVEMLHENAERSPDKTALRGMEENYTYSQLDVLTDAVGELLLKEGICTNDLIAVHFERHVDVFLAAIGCWKARAGYLYIDENAPDTQVKKILSDSGCKLVLRKDNIEGIKDKVLNNNYTPKELPKGDPEDLAWILYTSGSTGDPKGIKINQRNIAAHMRVAGALGIVEDDVQSMLASFSFMAGLLEGFPILYTGGTLTMIPNQYRRDLGKIERFWEEEKVTIGFVPSHYAERIVHEKHQLTTLRILLTGGEVLHHMDKMPFDIACAYGSSECGGPISICHINYSSDSYPIGEALPASEIYLLKEDSTERVTTIGEVGEICAAGPQISCGYLDRPELTKEKFIENPFSEQEFYTTLYRTGDLGRLSEGGAIYYVGRSDLMCKIKSFRIELTAVEKELLQFPGIERCVVKRLVDKDENEALHGFYYSKQAIDEDELRTFLREKLLHYMVPEYYHRLDHIEITDNGKVDRKAIKLDGYKE